MKVKLNIMAFVSFVATIAVALTVDDVAVVGVVRSVVIHDICVVVAVVDGGQVVGIAAAAATAGMCCNPYYRGGRDTESGDGRRRQHWRSKEQNYRKKYLNRCAGAEPTWP